MDQSVPSDSESNLSVYQLPMDPSFNSPQPGTSTPTRTSICKRTANGKVSFVDRFKCAARREVQQNWEAILKGATLDFGGGRVCVSNPEILAYKSPVFARLFQEEGVNLNFTHGKYDYEAFNEMLAYLHLGRLPCFDKFAEHFLAYAHEFQLSTLKQLSEDFLCTILKTDNAVHLYALAQQHSAVKLRECARDVMYKEYSNQFSMAFENYIANGITAQSREYGRVAITFDNGQQWMSLQQVTPPLSLEQIIAEKVSNVELINGHRSPRKNSQEDTNDSKRARNSSNSPL